MINSVTDILSAKLLVFIDKYKHAKILHECTQKTQKKNPKQNNLKGKGEWMRFSYNYTFSYSLNCFNMITYLYTILTSTQSHG